MEEAKIQWGDVIMLAEGQILEIYLSRMIPALSGETLFEKIEQFCVRFNVPFDIKESMHIIRHNRNVASHLNENQPKEFDYISPSKLDYQTFYKVAEQESIKATYLEDVKFDCGMTSNVSIPSQKKIDTVFSEELKEAYLEKYKFDHEMSEGRVVDLPQRKKTNLKFSYRDTLYHLTAIVEGDLIGGMPKSSKKNVLYLENVFNYKFQFQPDYYCGIDIETGKKLYYCNEIPKLSSNYSQYFYSYSCQYYENEKEFFDFRLADAKNINACEPILDKLSWEKYFSVVTRYPKTSAPEIPVSFDWENKFLIAIHSPLGSSILDDGKEENDDENTLFDFLASFPDIDSLKSVHISVQRVEWKKEGNLHIVEVFWSAEPLLSFETNDDGEDILVIEVELKLSPGDSITVKSNFQKRAEISTPQRNIMF